MASPRSDFHFCRAVRLSAVFLVVLATDLPASSPEENLQRFQLGDEMAGQLVPDEPVVFGVQLEAQRFMLGRVDQRGVDIAVRILAPDGERLELFDASARGLERFQVVAEDAGVYRIQLEALGEEGGDYALALERVEPAAETAPGKVDQQFARWDRNDVPGVAVGVVDAGKLVFSRAYGMANLTHGVKLTPELSSNIGSISKQFTAMALLLLEKGGKLSLDDPLRRYLPRLPPVAEEVTIKQVLEHTSGLREVINTLILSGWEPQDSLSREEVYLMMEDQTELQFEPGSEHLYNNTGYLLLADLVETITGDPFDSWMSSHIFAPLGMGHTAVRQRRGQILPQSAQGYLPDDEVGGFVEGGDIEQSWGAGGIYSTVADLARWMVNFRDGALGGPEVIERMTTPAVLTDGEVTDYGLGVAVDEYRGMMRIWHNGGDLAHTAMLVYLPEIDAGIIVLGNQPGFSGMGHANRLFEIFFADRLPDADVDEPGEEDAGATDEEKDDSDTTAIPATTLDAYAGKWELESVGLVVTLLRRGETLVLQIPNRPELTLTPMSQTELGIEGGDGRIQFFPEPDGRVERATWHQMGELDLRRVEEWNPAPDSLEAFSGSYLSPELETFWTVSLENGALVARQRRIEESVRLEPKEKDSFSGSPPLLEVRFSRDDNGRITGFFASYGRTRNIWFQRFPDDGAL